MSNLLSLIIDPAGIVGEREGFNLQVFPSGQQPLKRTGNQIQTSRRNRTANQVLLANSARDNWDFSTRFTVDHQTFNKLKALENYNKEASSQLLPFETVIYNLVEPFSEVSASRTRFIVPNTNIIDEEPNGTLTLYTYWIALQGVFKLTYEQVGKEFVVDFLFEEGTKLTSSMEQ